MAEVSDSAQEQILNFFRKFDRDCSGFIERKELNDIIKQVSPSDLNDKKIEQIFKVVDKNKDGRIDYKEFVEWLMNGSPSKRPKRVSEAPALNYKTWLPERFEVDISKRYALDKLEIGEGCYGKVFIAKDREFAGRTVAVKRVTKTRDCEVNEQFYEEINIMKALDHPNICKLLGTFEEGRHMFFIMEFCGGGELFERIVKQGYVDEVLSSDVVGQVTSALRYAHGRSIAHRDLKPENVVFFTDDPTDNLVKLIDWGLGISFAKGRMQAAVGTTMYAAPEVTSSRNVRAYTSACDLWSLGVLTFVMLCGTPPFAGSEAQRYELAMAEKYDLTGSIWDAVSEDAKDFVRSLIKVNVKERMQIDAAVHHPWLSRRRSAAGSEADLRVFSNIRTFANLSVCAAICTTAVARHLNHRDLRDIHQVFRRMDTNGDGVLCLDEIRAGFKDIFGIDHEAYKDVESAFGSMDLDCSGCIDYTEFCAAGLGEQACEQEDAIWAAFKAFDFDNTGRISREELRAVLQNADVEHAWTPWVCEAAVKGFLQKFDSDDDGYVEFHEFLTFMRRVWSEKREFDVNLCSSMTFEVAAPMKLAPKLGISDAQDRESGGHDVQQRAIVNGWAYELLSSVASMLSPVHSPVQSPVRSTETPKEEGIALPIASRTNSANLLPIKARRNVEVATPSTNKAVPLLPIASKRNSGF